MSKELKGANRITNKKLYGISKEEIISDILKVYKENGNKLTREEYLKKGKYSRAPIKRLFGTWNNLLKELNLDINVSRLDISKDEVIEDAKRVISEFGRIDAKLYRKEGKYSQAIVDRLFSSHTGLMKALGLHSKKAGRNITKEELLKELKKLYDKFGFLNSTLINEEFYISLPTVYSKIGNMNIVYQELEIDPPQCSKIGNDVIELISEILNEKPIKEWTCPQLKNPKTNMNLFIDGYFPQHNLAIEYDGIYHYEFTPHYHKTIDRFEYRKKLDKIKDSILDALDIKLIRIRYDEPIDKSSLEKKISNKLA